MQCPHTGGHEGSREERSRHVRGRLWAAGIPDECAALEMYVLLPQGCMERLRYWGGWGL